METWDFILSILLGFFGASILNFARLSFVSRAVVYFVFDFLLPLVSAGDPRIRIWIGKVTLLTWIDFFIFLLGNYIRNLVQSLIGLHGNLEHFQF